MKKSLKALLVFRKKANMNFKRAKKGAEENPHNFDDLGLGTKIIQSERIINKDGTFNVTREGQFFWTPYQSLVEMSWLSFLIIVLFVFFAINTSFGILYWMAGLEMLKGVGNTGSLIGDLANATFFSVQTFTTVGYGTMTPAGFITHLIASLNALIGLMAFALVTGLIFARFAKPKAQILVSDCALIAPYQEGTSFQFRIVNKRNSKIIDLEAFVVYTWIEKETGNQIRKYANLKLERQKVALFPLNWTIVHPINEDSPLLGKTSEMLHEENAEFIVQVKGFDETYAQMVHINSSYLPEEVYWNVRFKKMYKSVPGQGTVLRLDEINEVE